MSGDDGFLSRWSRRKTALRDGRPVAEPEAAPAAEAPPARRPSGPTAVPASADASPAVADESPAEAPAPPPPRLEDVEALTHESDFSRFTRPDVDPGVRTAALKKLFADPRFNVIDEMDIDIMDYGKLETLPPNLLRRMTQAHALGLFDDEDDEGERRKAAATSGAPAAAPADAGPATDPETPTPAANADAAAPTTETPSSDEDPDLRLQPDDAAGPASDRPGPEGDAGRAR